MKIVSYTEARSNLKDVLDGVVNDADVTVIHRRDGADAVIMGRDHYESMKETLYLLSNPANAKSLFGAIAQDKAGQAIERQLLSDGE